MSESKRAAVVKRGVERERRDLFASHPLDVGSVKQTLSYASADGGGVAARNESSVLFTVDALKGAARLKTPQPDQAPSSSSFRDDDEGIIDLNALSSSPPKAGARTVAPLFSEPPPAAFTRDASASSSGEAISLQGFKLGKRMIAGIAAAAVAVVLAGVGVAAAFKGEEPVHAANALAAPPPPPVASPAPKAPEPPPATASASSSAEEETSAPITEGKKKKGKGKGVAAKGHGKTKTEAAFVSKPTPKPADKCGCKGDFNCIIRCTATGK